MTAPLAFVRAVPDSFDRAIVRGDRPKIDVDRARVQHAGYVAAIAAAGYTIETVAADDAYPDCPFIEDAAVVMGGIGVITNPGAEARRGETTAVAETLGKHLALAHIEPPGTLDGGDVLQIHTTVFVGRSARTNDTGISQLAAIAMRLGHRTVAVDVTGVLHLKSAVSLLDDETVLIAPGCVDPAVFDAYRIIEKAPGEEHLASTLRLDADRLLITDTAPTTATMLTAAGYDMSPIDMSEFQAADGGLTCLSVLVPEL